MALTPTKKIPLGFLPPAFSLPDVINVSNKTFEDIKGEKGTLVMFICNHCPYVKHVIDELVKIGREYMSKGIGMVAINSNDAVNYPDDSPEKMVEFSNKHGFPFPYLFDESQQVARAYEAACTPDFNLFDQSNSCVYRGQLDGSRPGNEVPVNGENLRQALDQVLAGEEVPENQVPSIGCNIKWKA